MTKSITDELKELLAGSRIEKIYQSERDTIVIGIRSRTASYRLLASANPTMPRLHLTTARLENPSSPPMFCMLLRKHLLGSRISDITSHGFERIISITAESRDDFGDMARRTLVTEVMGRHSNIIFVDDKGMIVDSIKRIDNSLSRIREVLPGKPYILPPSQDKTDPMSSDAVAYLKTHISDQPGRTIEKSVLDSFIGFSPFICREICFRAGLDPDMRSASLDESRMTALIQALLSVLDEIRSGSYKPCIVFDNGRPLDFHCLDIKGFNDRRTYQTINEATDDYYTEIYRIAGLAQVKAALARSIGIAIEKQSKKRLIHEQVLLESGNKDKYRLFGQLLTAASHSIPANSPYTEVIDYTSPEGKMVRIELDPVLSATENAQLYFRKYRKSANAYSSALKHLNETVGEMEYLESVLHTLESASSFTEIEEIRNELANEGILSRQKHMRKRLTRHNAKKQTERVKHAAKSGDAALPPHAYVSSDGFTILAGRNNTQNDRLTLRQSSVGDLWLHTQKIPGSHVIIKTTGREGSPIPDRTVEEAAVIAAWHSKAKNSSNVPVDYTQVKNIKKPPGSKPGYVIYDHFKTAIVTPDASRVSSLRQDAT